MSDYDKDSGISAEKQGGSDSQSMRRRLDASVKTGLHSVPTEALELDEILREYGADRKSEGHDAPIPHDDGFNPAEEPFIEDLESPIDELPPDRSVSIRREARRTKGKATSEARSAVPEKKPRLPHRSEELVLDEEPEFDEEPVSETAPKRKKPRPEKKSKAAVRYRPAKSDKGSADPFGPDPESGVIETPIPEFEEDEPVRSVPDGEQEQPDVRERISGFVTEVTSRKKRRHPRILRKPSGSPVLSRTGTEYSADGEDQLDGLSLPRITAALRRGLLAVARLLAAMLVSLTRLFFPQEKAGERVYSDDLQALRGLTPEAAFRRTKGLWHSYRRHTFGVFLLTLPAAYLTTAPTLGLPLPGVISYVNSPYICLFLLTAIQIAAMLLSVNYLADGLQLVARRCWRTELLVLVAGIVNLLYTLCIFLSPQSGGYLPYHLPVLLMLFFGMLSRTLRYAGILRCCRAMLVPERRYVPICGIPDEEDTLTAARKGGAGGTERRLVDGLWEEDPSERLMRRYVPAVLLLTLALAVLAAFVGEDRAGFLWCWSALLSVALPGGLAMMTVLPLYAATGRLTREGIVFGGFRSAQLLAEADSVILQDRDLFRGEDINVEEVLFYGDYRPEKVNLYTLAMLRASGSVLYDVLAAALNEAPPELPEVEQLEFHDRGGVSAFISSNRVLVGSYTYLSRSEVAIPEAVPKRSGIYVAVNMQFSGLYQVSYSVRSPIRWALAALNRSGLTLVPAVRDFNLTEQFLQMRLGIPESGMDYPDAARRVALSLPDTQSAEESEEEAPDKLLAALSEDSAVHYADTMIAGKRIVRAAIWNRRLGLLSGAFGIILVFLLLLSRDAVTVAPYMLFAYGFFGFLPVLVLSIGAKRR